jgi:hypothetical protein
MWKWNKRTATEHPAESLTTRPDLQIRSLLDDPGLRRAMGLDQALTVATSVAPTVVSVNQRPRRRFDRRSLLEGVAA